MLVSASLNANNFKKYNFATKALFDKTTTTLENENFRNKSGDLETFIKELNCIENNYNKILKVSRFKE
jgi:hypothetical protein